jgi:hypothetical protein
MTMELEEINDRIVSIRRELAVKLDQLDGLLFSDPVTGMEIRYQIDCLVPRLDDLERCAYRLAREREALAGHTPMVF